MCNLGNAIWTQLHSAAHEFAHHGWRIMPDVLCRDIDSQRMESATVAPSTDAEVVERWWSQAPYPILLATGTSIDVVEVSIRVGVTVLRILNNAGSVGPVVHAHSDRWQFLVAVATDGAIDGDSEGPPPTSILLPPWVSASGMTCWRITPQEVGWRLPGERVVDLAIRIAREIQ